MVLTPLTPIVQDTAGVVGGVWVGDGGGAVVGDGNRDKDGDRTRAIAGAGVVVEATPPFACTLVCATIWVGVLDTPTIPFSGAGLCSGRLGSDALSSGQLGGRACCWGQGSGCVVGYCYSGCCSVSVVVVAVSCCCVVLFVVVLSFVCC